MHAADSHSEPGGLRLVRLINTQAMDIARREAVNIDRMCLYGTGEYWHGFEHSAYFLNRIFPDLESFVVNHPEYPFSIVGVSVPLKSFRRYMTDHTAARRSEDYMEFEVSSASHREYGEWHHKKVKEYAEVLGGVGMDNSK